MTNTVIQEQETLPEPETAERSGPAPRRIRTVLTGLMLGIFLAALDQNIVSVAIVRIANSLHGFDEQAWATTAYLITATITTPLYGKLADIYGRKPLYLASIALFVIGSVACTFATSMYELAGFRAFQGLGAGGLMALAFTILSDIVPPREIVRYQGGFMVVFGSATVLGPVLGGFLSDYDHLLGLDGWRWVFLVNVPIGVIAFAVVAKVLDVPHARQDHRIDWFGTLTLTACVVPLLIVAEQGRAWGWDSHRALLCYGVGAAGFVLYLLAELLMKDAALIPLRMFRSSTFSVAILGGTIVGIAMFGVIVLVPLYFQVVRGYSPTRAGLLMLPLVMGIMVGSQLAGVVTKFTGRYKILPVAGSFAFAAGAALFGRVEYDSPLWQPLLYCGIIGFGLGGCMQTLIIAAQNACRPEDRGTSTATATFVRQMGGTLGVAVFLTILFNLIPGRITAAFGGQLPADLTSSGLAALQSDTSGIAALPAQVRIPILIGYTHAMREVFLIAAVVAVLAGVVLLLMKEIPLQDDPLAESGITIPDDAAELLEVPPPTPPATEDDRYRSVDALLARADAEAGYCIVGHIRHDDGQPVPRATLTLIDPRGRQVSRTTGDADGGYLIAAPEPGSYVLIVSSAGHQPTASGIVIGWTPQQFDVVLHGAGEVSGAVRTAVNGTPVPHTIVTLTDANGEVVGSAVSAADGGYVCHGVVPGTYTLVALADHMRPGAATLTVPESRILNHDIVLAPRAVLAGSVVAEDNRPVPDAQVAVLDAAGGVTATVRTDDNGQYLVPDLTDGQYTVVTRGYPPVSSRITVAGGEATHHVRVGYWTED
ncbi:MFS transporter [Nocardia jiangxiensis]|uniref:MFS transporter n=1 Tax=Nocardia jiangxiensis TaxID=282685 RepID=A0ABW6SA46_9NOCA|nr:MFS transporter [Nocardia jiangxiensis]